MGPEEKSLKRCVPCKCGGRAEWGAGFLICNKCGWETDNNRPNGNSVRQWNKQNKKENK